MSASACCDYRAQPGRKFRFHKQFGESRMGDVVCLTCERDLRIRGYIEFQWRATP